MNPFIERYQLIYEKDPNSKVFAPLAEAYRRMGLLNEAIDMAERGVMAHPNFASGRVALGKCYAQKGRNEQAVEQLKAAVELSPENILAHQLLADCLMKLEKPVEALNAAKMVLFLNPTDKKALDAVSKLERSVYTQTPSAIAIDEDFSMEKLSSVAAKANEVGLGARKQTTPPPAPTETLSSDINFERELALLDSRLSRGDWANARAQIREMLTTHENDMEVLRRKARIDEMTSSHVVTDWLKPSAQLAPPSKRQKLEKLLAQIEDRRRPI